MFVIILQTKYYEFSLLAYLLALTSETKSGSVLVVDDSEAIRLLLKETISSGNLKKKVIEASNGIDAVKLFQQYKPDLVILDIMMPRADGLQVLQALFKLDKNVKILIMSSNENRDFITQAMRRGVSGFLLKPFDRHYALQAITQILNRK